MKQPSSAVVHFYRAIVMHGDVWRKRLDATTNWAVVTTIGVVSFAFTRPDAPHFILLFLISADALFLTMETRRYQIYDLWRRRIRSINKYVIAPQLSPKDAPSADEIERELSDLAADLGRAVPHLPFLDALGYRLRRNYGYIYLFTVGSWVIKLYLHPIDATTTSDLLDRASVGMIPGSVTILIVALSSVIILFAALRAPSEQMMRWRRIPSPLKRLKTGSLFPPAMSEPEEEQRLARPGALAPRPLKEAPSGGEEDDPNNEDRAPEQRDDGDDSPPENEDNSN